MTAIVSPKARPNPNNTADIIFGPDARKIIFCTVSHFVAPIDNEASFKPTGIERKDSIQTDIIIGNTITANIIEAENIHRPVLSTPKKGAILSFTSGTRNKKAHKP